MIAAATNRFGLSLWQHAPAGNYAMSPASIATALAMVWTGARGDTELQIRSVLHLDGDLDAVTSAWSELARELVRTGAGTTLKMANRLYGQRGYDFLPAFTERLASTFGAPLEVVDFMSGARDASNAMNAWVAAMTEDKIHGLVSSSSIQPTTRLFLINALYFHGKWAAPFERAKTHAAPFWLSNTASTNVPTMHRTGTYRTAPVEGGSMIELPYRGNDTVMWILVPEARDGLAQLERHLNADVLARWVDQLRPELVALALPRFTLDSPVLELKPALRKLGMSLPFTPGADFSGMSQPAQPQDQLYLSEVLHKAFVATDEEGTTAAAATAAKMLVRGAPPRPRPFVVDRPFVFVIADTSSKLALFVGRVVEP